MFRTLLVFLILFRTAGGFSQTAVPNWSAPSEMVTEDPNMIIEDLTVSISSTNKILLKWRLNGKLPQFFAIERSENGKDFEVMTVLNSLNKQANYTWTDEAPKKGRSFYRIRYAYTENAELYSKTLMAAIAADVSYKFYPNPVDHILIVRSEVPLDVQILDGNGKIRITEPGISGLRTINVANLEKGIYLIRFSNKLINVMSQEKLVKN